MSATMPAEKLAAEDYRAQEEAGRALAREVIEELRYARRTAPNYSIPMDAPTNARRDPGSDRVGRGRIRTGAGWLSKMDAIQNKVAKTAQGHPALALGGSGLLALVMAIKKEWFVGGAVGFLLARMFG